MIKYIKTIGTFEKNIILVFLGSSLLNVFNLFYQLLIAHSLSSVDFAAFNSLLSIVMLISAPLATLQTAVVKYLAEFNARGQAEKVKVFISALLRKILPLMFFTCVISYFFSFYILDKLKISSFSSAYILSGLLALCWLTPLCLGVLQGLELFKWLVSVSVISGALKLALAFIFVALGFDIAGALGAFLAASFAGAVIAFVRLRSLFSLRITRGGIDLKEFLLYLCPVAISFFCFTSMISFDMLLVKYYFTSLEAGYYSLAQMVGKIFLFLPGAISMVMFPKIAGLNARNMDTRATLRRSLLYASALALIANAVYNLCPRFILKALTGKVFAESVTLGRLFGISMTFFTLLYILIAYFLSLKDLRFMKYLIAFALLQLLGIRSFHKNLVQVQLVLCASSISLFFIHLALAYRKKNAVLSYAG